MTPDPDRLDVLGHTGEPATPLTLLVADRHPLFLDAIARVFERVPSVQLVGMSTDAESALTAIRTLHPAIAVIGHAPPMLDAASLLGEVSYRRLAVRIVVVTDRAQRLACTALIEAGAASCVPRSVSAEQLIAVVLACGLSGVVLPWEIAGRFIPSARAPALLDSALLSAREREILQFVADDKRPSVIAHELFLSPATVRTHLARTYRKLSVSGASAAVAEALRRGLIN